MIFKKFDHKISSIIYVLSLAFLLLFYSCSSKVEESAIDTEPSAKEVSIAESDSTADSHSSSSNFQSFKINQSWSQEPSGYERNVFYKYPENGNNNNPVAILLHGAGGTPQIELDEYNYLINHILVAPEGYDQGWNIAREDSKAPDLDFIKKIILHLKTFEKINTDQISIIGHSNGAALVNQLLIELESESFKKAVFTFCQLNTFQYREGSFWARSNIDSEVHDLEVLPASNNRKILSFAGTEDGACIYYGGEGIHKYNFVNAEVAAFAWAKAFGYEGVQIENPIEEAAPLENFYRFSYLDSRVIHYKLQGAGHGWEQNFDGKEVAKPIIKNFIEN